jgi:hypothetical protein
MLLALKKEELFRALAATLQIGKLILFYKQARVGSEKGKKRFGY